MSETALVLFSGGQDSTTCLAWALDRFDRVETIGFERSQSGTLHEERPALLERRLDDASGFLELCPRGLSLFGFEGTERFLQTREQRPLSRQRRFSLAQGFEGR